MSADIQAAAVAPAITHPSQGQGHGQGQGQGQGDDRHKVDCHK